MKVKNKRTGDVFLNPIMGDLWILRQDYDREKDKDIWVLQLVHSDIVEELQYVKGFARIGNIYDMVAKELEERYGCAQEEEIEEN